MTMILELTEAQKERLQRYAASTGISAEMALIQIVEELPGVSAGQESLPQRVSGLFAGKFWMSDDFDDPLPNDFWFSSNPETESGS